MTARDYLDQHFPSEANDNVTLQQREQLIIILEGFGQMKIDEDNDIFEKANF